MVEVPFPHMTGNPEDFGVLIEWRAPNGSSVSAYQVIAEVTIEKFDAEINAPQAGTLRWQVQAGEEVVQGATIATIE